jgi:hypothetical protein
MPPFGMYVIMAPRSAIPGAPVHSSPIVEGSHTSQNDVCATREGGSRKENRGLALSNKLT